MNKKVIMTALIILCNAIQAEDLGVIGKTYPIGEQSTIELIKNNAQQMIDNGGWEKIRQKTIQKVENQIDYPPVIMGIGTTTESSVRYYDPSIIVNHDIINPFNHTVMAYKGQRIYPSDYLAFKNELIFIDGRQPEQIEYELRESSRSPFRTSIVLIAVRDYRGLLKKTQHLFYYDQNATLVKKFGIRNVPTIIYQDTVHPRELRIEEVKP